MLASIRNHHPLYFPTVVDLVCPLNVTVSTDPGSNTNRVNWQEPDLTGWNKTNFTSTAVSGNIFPIGSKEVTYHQWFGTRLSLTCSFYITVAGEGNCLSFTIQSISLEALPTNQRPHYFQEVYRTINLFQKLTDSACSVAYDYFTPNFNILL